MRFSGNLRKVLITISLALLVAFLSVLKLPQVALSRVQYSGDWEQRTFDWSMYNYDPHGTRYNTNERLLAANNVGNLKMQWTFTTPTPVTATPSVFEDRVYFVYVGTGDPTYLQNTSSNKPGSVVAFGLP